MNTNVGLIYLLTLCYHSFGGIAPQYLQNQPASKLIGGHSASPSDHPYLVSLQTRLFMIRAHVCGGTLLNTNWILTAAHCVKESFLVRWLPMDAMAGASTAHDVQHFGPDAQIIPVNQRIPHPDYAGGIGPNDIAVVRTSSPFRFTKFVQPASLPVPTRTTYEPPLTLSGWGILRTTFFFPDLPRYLQEVNVTYLPHNECYDAVEAIKDKGEVNPLDAKSNICTGPITGGVSACSGDSGGPLIQMIKEDDTGNEDEDEDDNYPMSQPLRKGEDKKLRKGRDDEMIPTVVGVVSWGSSPCGEKGAPTVYTKVIQFLDFINKHVKYFICFIL